MDMSVINNYTGILYIYLSLIGLVDLYEGIIMDELKEQIMNTLELTG